MRSLLRISALLLVLLCSQVHAEQWVVNPNPDDLIGCVRINDAWRAVKLPALSCVPTSALKDVDLPAIEVFEMRSGFVVRAHGASLILDGRGIRDFSIAGNSVPVKCTPDGPLSVRMLEESELAVVFEIEAEGTSWILTLAADGALSLRGSGVLTFEAGGEAAMWCYKPYGALGWTKTRGTGRLHFHASTGFSSDELYSRSLFPGEATGVGRDDGAAIMVIRPEDPESQVRVQPEPGRFQIGEKGKSCSYSMRLAGSEQEARRLCVNAQAPFTVSGQDGVASGVPPWGQDWAIEVADRDGNGPDFSADVWTVTHRRKFRGRIAFGQEGGELRADLSKDANRDGEVRGIEAEYPYLRLIDWNGDGHLFEGPVFYGGFIQCDRYLMQTGQPDVIWDLMGKFYDLDGDGDWDIAQGSGLHLDYYDRDIGFHVRPGFFDVVKQNGGDAQAFPEICGPSWFLMMHTAGARFDAGGTRDGALFHKGEQHISCELDEQDPQPEAKYRVVGGGNCSDYHDMPSIQLARLTMGNLDREPRVGGYDWDVQFSTFREGQQPHDLGEGIHVERTVTYEDAYGHTLKVRTPVLPSGRWKGEKLPLRAWPAGWGNVDAAPWALLATARYPYVSCVFAPEEDEGEMANEGFHQWIIHRAVKRRWEVNPDGTDGKTPLTLYYSPLMGALHYKGAHWGHVDAPRTRTDPEPGRPGKDGTPLTIATARAGGFFGDTHRHRLWGDFFLSFHDRDNDGYFDLYFWDKENDGAPDSILWYDAKGGTVTVWQPGYLGAWPLAVECEDAPYLLNYYDRISSLYQKGISIDPLVQRVSFDDQGRPLVDGRTPPGARPLPVDEMPVAAADSYYSGIECPWCNFRPEGLLRLGTMLAQKGFRLATFDAPFTTDRLTGIDLLVLPGWGRIPDDEEWRVLEAWVRQGGRLLLTNTAGEATSAALMSALVSGWDVGVAEETMDRLAMVWRRPNYLESEGEMRICTPANRIEHFDSSAGGLLDGFSYLSFRGRPLAIHGSSRPLLSCEGKAIAAEVTLGGGKIIVSDANWFANLGLFHPQGVQTEAGVSNMDLVDRLIERLVAGVGRTPGTAL